MQNPFRIALQSYRKYQYLRQARIDNLGLDGEPIPLGMGNTSLFSVPQKIDRSALYNALNRLLFSIPQDIKDPEILDIKQKTHLWFFEARKHYKEASQAAPALDYPLHTLQEAQIVNHEISGRLEELYDAMNAKGLLSHQNAMAFREVGTHLRNFFGIEASYLCPAIGRDR